MRNKKMNLQINVPESELLMLHCQNDIAKPEIAVYMVGEGNRYGHPHEDTIRVLCDVGAKIYEADIHGSIVITTNGEDYEIQFEKPAPSVKLATEGQPTEVK
jgi:hypothetical protein